MENKKIILAIDDNETQLILYQEMLAPKYDLRIVKSASQALHFLNTTNNVSVILLDIEMPHISGFEFLKDIRKIPSYMRVPIIIISGNTGEAFSQQARNSSAADVLTKPVVQEILVRSIEKSLP
jgi:putative two-component system response regulator